MYLSVVLHSVYHSIWCEGYLFRLSISISIGFSVNKSEVESLSPFPNIYARLSWRLVIVPWNVIHFTHQVLLNYYYFLVYHWSIIYRLLVHFQHSVSVSVSVKVQKYYVPITIMYHRSSYFYLMISWSHACMRVGMGSYRPFLICSLLFTYVIIYEYCVHIVYQYV